MSDDKFMQVLADGGHMIGELAKFYYKNNPLDPDITVKERGYSESTEETNHRIQQDLQAGIAESILAEAAIRHENYFIRVDVLILNHHTKTIKLVEVKAKSVSSDDIEGKFVRNSTMFTKWSPYLYDVAFQTVVLEKAISHMLDGALKEYKITPYLMLVDKEAVCDMSGLHEFVRVIRNSQDSRQIEVRVPEGVTREHMGNLEILREVNVSGMVDLLRKSPVAGVDLPREAASSLESFMEWSCQIQQSGQPYFIRPDKRCKKCQYRAKAGEGLQSGIHMCWKHALDQNWLQTSNPRHDDVNIPLSIDLWGGKAGPMSFADEALGAGYAFLSDIQSSVMMPKYQHDPGSRVLTASDRRNYQIDLEKDQSKGYYVKKEKIKEYIQSWEWPWHMIDFETATPVIPFTEGIQPYKTVAFQFSHHIMERDGSIRHATQFIDVEPESSPNIQFVRALKKALMPNGSLEGTVFKYSSHENSVLNQMRGVIMNHSWEKEPFDDQDELVDFIELLTTRKEKNKIVWEGPKSMTDLLDVVYECYISHRAGGSNSLKYVLPSILHDAPRVALKYSTPGLYGNNLAIHSLNFEHHTWLTPETKGDPYKTLPPLFSSVGLENEEIDELVAGFLGENESIDQGGLAMAAYNYTRYVDLSDDARIQLRDGLLRYCELDTLAMCMLMEGLIELSEG